MRQPREDEAKEERGPKNPADSLRGAVDLLHQVRDKVGFTAASRELLAEALGYSGLNGASNRRIASLLHFGLLVRTGSQYRISALGKQILAPTNATEESEALAQAATRPALYVRLLERFGGHALPSMLPNLLFRDFQVPQKSSEEVAGKFRETMEFAGLLRNGILFGELEEVQSEEIVSDVGPVLSANSEGQASIDSISSASRPQITTFAETSSADGRTRQRYTIALDGAGSHSVIEMPLPLKPKDLRKVSAWVNYMLMVVEEETPDISGN